MPSKLDVLIGSLHETTGKPEKYLRASLQAKMGEKSVQDLLQEELSPKEAEDFRLSLTQSAMILSKDQVDNRPMQEKVKEANKLAGYQLQTLIESEPPRPAFVVTKEIIRRIGEQFWPVSYAIFPRLEDTHRTANHLLEAVDVANEKQRLWLSTFDGQAHALAAACWVENAFPLVRLASHRYAAALCSTRIPKDLPINPPWGAFIIDLPTGMFETTTPEGETTPLTFILVHSHPVVTHPIFEDDVWKSQGEPIENRSLRPEEYHTVWSFWAYSQAGLDLHRVRRQVDDHLEDISDESAFPDAYDLDLDPRDSRTMVLLTRLVFNTCLAMSNPEYVKPLGKHPRGWTRGPGRGQKEPTYRTYKVGKPIELDCREPMRAYLLGIKRNPMSVQCLVRGHWRNQACGPRLSLRRATWIEPYWKGPEDAPINVRPHDL